MVKVKTLFERYSAMLCYSFLVLKPKVNIDTPDITSTAVHYELTDKTRFRQLRIERTVCKVIP